MCECKENVIPAAVVTTTAGFYAGAPSSCLKFIIYIDQLIRMLQREISEDIFLGTLHLRMGDIVAVATFSNTSYEEKVQCYDSKVLATFR